jgi:hypothetical protein
VKDRQTESGFGTSPAPPLLLHSKTREIREEKQQLLVEKDKEVLKRLQSKVHPMLLLSEVDTRCFLSDNLPKELRHLKLQLKYSTEVDGYSIATMMSSVKGPHWVLVVVTSTDKRFGVCVIDTPIAMGTSIGPSPSMFFFTLPSSSTRRSEEEEEEEGQQQPFAYKKISNDKDGMLCVTSGFFAVGPAEDGDGYGLFLSDGLQQGSSVNAAGFSNPSLHLPSERNADARNFDVSGIEMYELIF